MNQTFIDGKFSLKTTLWYAQIYHLLTMKKRLHTNEMDVIVC